MKTKFYIICYFLFFSGFVNADFAISPFQLDSRNSFDYTNKLNSIKMTLRIPPISNMDLFSYLLMDTKTGDILLGNNIDKRIPPASLSKLMVHLVIKFLLNNNQISLDDKVSISEHAWRMPGSKMFIREGTEVEFLKLLEGMIVASGNDATVALAEHIAGNEENFINMMNSYVEYYNLKNTFFEYSASGIEGGYVSAYDVAKMSLEVIRDKKLFPIYSQKTFVYQAPKEESPIKQYNRNKLLFRDDRVDGIKTGFIPEAGYHLVASAYDREKDLRLLVVVLGANGENSRARYALSLLNYGFTYFQTKVISKNKVFKIPVIYGKNNFTEVVLKNDVYLTLPKFIKNDLEFKVNIIDKTKDKNNKKNYIFAGINKGEEIGFLSIVLDGLELRKEPLFTSQNVVKAGFFKRMFSWLWFKFKNMFN